MTWVWMMAHSGVSAHAVAEDVRVRQGRAPAACSPIGRFVRFDLASAAEDPKCRKCLNVIAEVCGTFRGYQRHRRQKTPKCEPCIEANTRYQRDRRAADPTARRKDRAGEAVRWRARLRLAAEFPDRYMELLAEERAR